MHCTPQQAHALKHQPQPRNLHPEGRTRHVQLRTRCNAARRVYIYTFTAIMDVRGMCVPFAFTFTFKALCTTKRNAHLCAACNLQKRNIPYRDAAHAPQCTAVVG